MGARNLTFRLNRLSHGCNTPCVPKSGTATYASNTQVDKTTQLYLNRNKVEALRQCWEKEHLPPLTWTHSIGRGTPPLTPISQGPSPNSFDTSRDVNSAASQSDMEVLPNLSLPLPAKEAAPTTPEERQLSDMPVDILCRILAHMPRSSWAAARGVCTSWREAVGTHEVLWQRRKVGLKDNWAILAEWVFSNPKEKRCHLWAFDPSDKHMYRVGYVPEMPKVNHQSPIVSIGPYAVFFGGTISVENEDGTMDIVPGTAAWNYHLQTSRLRQMPDMLQGRVNFASAVINGKLVVAGGTGPKESALSSVEEFDPETEEWSSLLDLTCPRAKCFVGEKNGQFYVFSQNADEAPQKYAEVYDTVTKTWAMDRKASHTNFMPKSPTRFNLVVGSKVELTRDLRPNQGCGSLDGHKNTLSRGNQISWCTFVM